MELRPLGRSGLWVGRLGLGTGTWTRGTDEYEARDQLAAFLDAGGTLIDTADVYADGDAEALLGELVEEFEVRDEVVLATKAGAVGGTGPARQRLPRPPACARSRPRCAGCAPRRSTCGRCTPGIPGRRWTRPWPPSTTP